MKVVQLVYHYAASVYELVARGFPGSPMVKTVSSQCRGHGLDLWLGN